jgi:hypothetical protein
LIPRRNELEYPDCGPGSSLDSDPDLDEDPGSESDSDLLGILDIEQLEAEVDELLRSRPPATILPAGSISGWYQGEYPLHTKTLLCVEADRKRREMDIQRQLRDKRQLERWPRIDGVDKLRLLYEGLLKFLRLTST